MSALYRWLAIAAIAIAAMGWAYVRGIERESDRRDALELKKEKKDAEDLAKFLKRGRDAVAANQVLRRQNREYYRQLQEQIGHVDPSTLTEGCPAAGSPPSPGPVELLLTGRFVELYNRAWRAAGTNVPGDSAGAPGDAGGTAAAGPEEVLAHNAREAESCGEDRKRYARLIKLLTAPEGQ